MAGRLELTHPIKNTVMGFVLEPMFILEFSDFATNDRGDDILWATIKLNINTYHY